MTRYSESFARAWDQTASGAPEGSSLRFWYFERRRDGRVFGPYQSEAVRNSMAYFFQRLDEETNSRKETT